MLESTVVLLLHQADEATEHLLVKQEPRAASEIVGLQVIPVTCLRWCGWAMTIIRKCPIPAAAAHYPFGVI